MPVKYHILFIQGAGTDAIKEEQIIADRLQQALGESFRIIHPPMPDADQPDYKTWKAAIAAHLNNLQGPVILLGHSLGGSILLKYFSQEGFPGNIIATILFGIPFWDDQNRDVSDFAIGQDAAKSLSRLENLYFYHSLDDEVVPLSHYETYKKLISDAHWRLLSGIDHSYSGATDYITEDIKSITEIT